MDNQLIFDITRDYSQFYEFQYGIYVKSKNDLGELYSNVLFKYVLFKITFITKLIKDMDRNKFSEN